MNDISEAPKVWSETRAPLSVYDPPVPDFLEGKERIWPRVAVFTMIVTIVMGALMYLLFNDGVGHLMYLASQQ